MRLGLSLLSASVDLAAAAEGAGFETLYLTERHFDLDGGLSNPFAMAAAISGRLQHAWLAVRPDVGLHHPLRLVEQGNLLDVLTHGRCLIVLDDTAVFDRLIEIWNWRYEEGGPPLEFAAGPYSARMAGRVMPAPCRQPHPLLALETDSADLVADAARRGWGVQLRGAHTDALARLYRDTLTRSGHSSSTVEECLRWLVAVTRVTAHTNIAAETRRLSDAGVAEVRLDAAPGVSINNLMRQVA
jgi:alkanesulfonate monooxygenase SsuD/methylene tetrahydromethanopterin reductase-like flavin-dependent oxidoreductase (luciferase family)